MASFFGLFRRSTGSSQSPGRISYEDIYQTIDDNQANQPQNEYKDVMLLEGHTRPVKHILQINNTSFLTAGDDTTIIVWDIESGSQLHVLSEHTSPVTAVCRLRDNSRRTSALGLEGDDSILIMTASKNEMIRWEMSLVDERFDPDTNCKRITDHQGSINCLTLLRHGMLCSGGKDLCLWDIATGKLLSKYNWSQNDTSEISSILELEGRNFGVVVASSHTHPAVFDIKKSTMSQLTTYQLEFSGRVPNSYHHLPVSVLAPLSSTVFVTGALDGTVVIWSMNTLSMVKRFECVEDQGYDFTNSAPPLSTSSDTQTSSFPVTDIMTLCERYMFVAIGKGFKVFDIYSSDGGSQSISEIPSMPKPVMVHSNAHKSNVTSMQFLPDKNILITASMDSSVRLWGSRGLLPSSPTKDVAPSFHEPAVNLQTAIETFLGVQHTKQASKKRSQVRFTPIVPLLIGELCLHTDSVQNVLYLGKEMGVVTVGDDNNVLLWKESELESMRKDEEIQRHLRREMFYDVNQ